ncbi:MAG: hypothetical protein IKH56_07175 [Oscillospiraceae bacterium]|nr:hypothetical protein [Oscillospiraceae bacterium]
MFGYIRPVFTRMQGEEQEDFRSCYCGLCRCMGQRFGQISRLLLNYDFVFLAMLLWKGKEKPEREMKRCPYVCFRRKCSCRGNADMERAAALSVILSWWKFKDSVRDEKALKKAAGAIAMMVMRRAYRRAAKAYPEFDEAVERGIAELSALEKKNCESIDETADCFARILCSAAEAETGDRRRVLEQLLYHVGRWIYLADARDDLQRDEHGGAYNPLLFRFTREQRTDGTMDERLRATMLHSRNLAGAAFELMEENAWSGSIRNILYFGLPSVARAIFDGEWKNRKEKLRKDEA